MPSEVVTKILQRIVGGERDAFQELLPLVHEELQALAGSYMQRVAPGHTLQTTALVNEACAKLLGQADPRWEDRRHFVSAASQAMRHILVDHARARLRKKRGGGHGRAPMEVIDGIAAPDGPSLPDLLALDEALEKLANYDERKARVVELRVFSGLTSEDTAHALEVGKRTVERDFRFALTWLRREMSRATNREGFAAGEGTQ